MRQNFRVGKLLRLCTKYTIHWKTFTVHQAMAIMYCTQQVIQEENFHNRLENRESSPTRKFCRIRYVDQDTLIEQSILDTANTMKLEILQRKMSQPQEIIGE